MRGRIVRCTAIAAVLVLATAHAASHVVVFGVDGLGPEGVEHAATPVMHGLMKRGASSLHARGVIPTVSSPNWASMIMGAGPADHGVTSNDWQPDKYDVPPLCKGTGGIFPTIFGLLRAQRPGTVIGVFHDWDGFGRLLEKGVADVVKDGDGPDETVEMAVRFVAAKRPALLFIQCDHVDGAGHKFGYGSPEYLQAVTKADALLGKVLAALDAAGIGDSTVVMVTADHGGKGKKHGGLSLAELEVPWIIAGPGVAASKELPAPVRIADTAPTIAHILGLKTPWCWSGKPVLAAFLP